MQKKALTLYYIVLLCLIVPVILFWWHGNSANLLTSADNLVVIGRLLGLISAFAIFIEIILVSRLPIIEKYFDLHDNNDLHRLNGFLILFTFIGHIVFITIGYALTFKTGLINQFVDLNQASLAILLASIGTLVFVATIGLSLKVIRKAIPYQLWYLSHILLYSAIVLTFLHQITDGRDFINQPLFRAYWIALLILVFGSLILYRFIRPIKNYIKHKFYVSNIVQEADGIYSIIIKGKNLEQFHYDAGQYASLWFLSGNTWWESHPYSFSSHPQDGFIRFTVKSSGDFGKKIPKLKQGTPVIIDGPRGSFRSVRATSDSVILVAGGIGIAPFIPITKELLAQRKSVSLLYAIHDDNQLAFKGELKDLQKAGLNLHIFNSSANDRINDNVLNFCASKNVNIFLCGPTAMTEQFCSTLCKCGLKKNKIISERFSY